MSQIFQRRAQSISDPEGRKLFRETLGVRVKEFYENPIVGFDGIAFDKWMQEEKGYDGYDESLEDFILRTYPEKGEALFEYIQSVL